MRSGFPRLSRSRIPFLRWIYLRLSPGTVQHPQMKVFPGGKIGVLYTRQYTDNSYEVTESIDSEYLRLKIISFWYQFSRVDPGIRGQEKCSEAAFRSLSLQFV